MNKVTHNIQNKIYWKHCSVMNTEWLSPMIMFILVIMKNVVLKTYHVRPHIKKIMRIPYKVKVPIVVLIFQHYLLSADMKV